MKSRHGISLIEVLVVLTIVALLASLLLPVLAHSKAYSRQAPCISNQRQLYVAWSTYSESWDGAWPAVIQQFASSRNVRAVLRCPADGFGGANRAATAVMGTPVSYFYIMPPARFREDIRAADPNHGVLYCVAHGERDLRQSDDDPRMATTGTVLRTRVDGSVSTVKVPLYCSDVLASGMKSCGRDEWYLLTEARPCPPLWCGGEDFPQN